MTTEKQPMETLFETITKCMTPETNGLNSHMCFNPNHKTILCRDGVVRCLDESLRKISAQHHPDRINIPNI